MSILYLRDFQRNVVYRCDGLIHHKVVAPSIMLSHLNLNPLLENLENELLFFFMFLMNNPNIITNEKEIDLNSNILNIVTLIIGISNIM